MLKWTLEAAIEAGVLLAAAPPFNKSREWVDAALSFDPFMGDFGDGTERVLKDQLDVVRRGGHCMYSPQMSSGISDCKGSGRVVKGELVRTIRKVDEDGWFGGRICHACLDAEANQLLDDMRHAEEVLADGEEGDVFADDVVWLREVDEDGNQVSVKKGE